MAEELEVDGHEVGEAEVGHEDEPVAEASGGDGAVEQEPDGDDGFERRLLFDVDEDEEEYGG